MPEREELQGTVERIVFRNEQNGWTVLDLSGGGELHKVVGVLPAAYAGEYLRLRGHWGEHKSFGVQFCAEECEHELPTGAEAVLRYLSSGAVKGIRESTAGKIWEAFGEDTLRVLEQEPERLAEIRGISPERARKIGEEFAAQFGLREVMLALGEYGLTPNEAIRCFKKWGVQTIERVKQNPYQLCGNGLYISFERADQICAQMERPADDSRRIEAGLLYVLRHNLSNGHTCLPADKLTPTAARLLGLPEEPVASMLESMAAAFTIKRKTLEGRDYVFLPAMYNAETYIALRLVQASVAGGLPESFLERRLAAMEAENGIAYADRQKEAIRQALDRGTLVLTGGPGTGKTTTLKAIITLLEEMGETVAVAAPTGRAAKRLAELTGSEAKTIHRLLEVQWNEDDMAQFARNEQNPLDIDALVLDEMSMVDAPLMEGVLRALKPGCRLVMVGDTDQLPAVGPGCVLQDIIASGALPVVQLTEIFRQAMESRIVMNAHRIVRGEMPDLSGRDGDFFFLPQPGSDQVAETVLDLCARRLPQSYGLSAFGGIQVLCPGRQGELGTVALNRLLQEKLNPPDKDKRTIEIEGVRLRVGDKVMHVRNNYDIVWTKDGGDSGTGVFNGDIGVLEEIDRHGETLSVRYDDRVALYTRQDAQDLQPAYAVTVHKSQGSEFDAVILPLYHQQRLLCYRNLLYTAVTRARRLLIVVGSRATVEDMVRNDRKTLRYSGLKHFIHQWQEAGL